MSPTVADSTKGKHRVAGKEVNVIRGHITKRENTSKRSIYLFIDYISVVMQCLYASKSLVNAYLNVDNAHWTNTPFNRRFQEYFQDYQSGEGPLDPVKYVEEALLFKEKNFEYLKPHDPTEAIERIFHALIFSHAKKVRDIKRLPEDAYVKPSLTFFGKFITSIIYTYCTNIVKYYLFSHLSYVQA